MKDTNKRLKRLSLVMKTAVVLLTAGYALSAGSCANTGTPPKGGPKDTIPPVIVQMLPDSNAVNVPTEKTRLQFKFNEYVVVKDANTNVLLSPPQEKKPELKIKGKSVVVTFKEPLDSNTTYCLDFGNSIVDNNEGNIMMKFMFPFSTGSYIDSMYCAGKVLNSQTLYPEENITVAFYLNHADSCIYKTLPDAVAKSDKWGYFIARNLKPEPYRVYAFKDENANNKYDPYTERIAFMDSLFTPSKVLDTIAPELKVFDMEDTLACLARPSEFNMLTFMETSPEQYIKDRQRTDVRSMYIKFGAPYVRIDSLWFDGIDSSLIIKEFNVMQDSLCLWINDRKDIKDTLKMGIKYWKTDTLGELVPTYDTIRYVIPKEKRKSDEKKYEKKDANAKREDLLEVTIDASSDMIEQYGIRLETKDPIIDFLLDSIAFTYKTPKQQEGVMNFDFVEDTTTIRKFTIRAKEKYMPGYEYSLYFPMATFTDVNGFTNDSTVTKIGLPTDDKLSTLTVNLTGVESIYIIDLVDEKRTKVLRGHITDQDTTLIFPYLKAGKYSIRITEDKNSNSLFDTGSLKDRRQPEKVIFYKLADGNDLIEIKEMTDIEQDIDIKAIEL